jgi:hypothetical protein
MLGSLVQGVTIRLHGNFAGTTARGVADYLFFSFLA